MTLEQCNRMVESLCSSPSLLQLAIKVAAYTSGYYFIIFDDDQSKEIAGDALGVKTEKDKRFGYYNFTKDYMLIQRAFDYKPTKLGYVSVSGNIYNYNDTSGAGRIGWEFFNASDRSRFVLIPMAQGNNWPSKPYPRWSVVSNGDWKGMGIWGFNDDVYNVPKSKGGCYLTAQDVLCLCSAGQVYGQMLCSGINPHGFGTKGAINYNPVICFFRGWNPSDITNNPVNFPNGAIDRDSNGRRILYGAVDERSRYLLGTPLLLTDSSFNLSNAIRLDEGYDLPRVKSNYNARVGSFVGNDTIFTFSKTFRAEGYVNPAELCDEGSFSLRISQYDDVLTNPEHSDAYIEIYRRDSYDFNTMLINKIDKMPIEEMFDEEVGNWIQYDISDVTGGYSDVLDHHNITKLFRHVFGWDEKYKYYKKYWTYQNDIWGLIGAYIEFLYDEYNYKKQGGTGEFYWDLMTPRFMYRKNHSSIKSMFKAQLKELLSKLTYKSSGKIFNPTIEAVSESPIVSIPVSKGTRYYIYMKYQNGKIGKSSGESIRKNTIIYLFGSGVSMRMKFPRYSPYPKESKS